jgi:hypothetical protein
VTDPVPTKAYAGNLAKRSNEPLNNHDKSGDLLPQAFEAAGFLLKARQRQSQE